MKVYNVFEIRDVYRVRFFGMYFVEISYIGVFKMCFILYLVRNYFWYGFCLKVNVIIS